MRLLERERELAVIEESIERAREGAGSLLLVEGPAGIGKTALLRAAAERGSAAGLDVLGARGGELERSLSFGIARQLLERRVADADERERAALFEGAAALAAPALGGTDTDASAGGTEDPGPAIQHGLYWLVANLAGRRPLLVCVDDLHWGDRPSLRWLLYLARRLEELPVVIVAGARRGEPGADEDLIESLAAERVAEVARPGELSEAASAAIVRTHLGDVASDRFVAACWLTSGGNPFLLTELVGAIERDRIPPSDDSVARIEGVAPEAISRSILLRLARMPEAAAPVANAVAILGARADLGSAAALAGLDVAMAGEAADALAAASILSPGTRLGFAHPLIASAVYEQIPPAELALAHARAARLLADRGADDEEVAAQLMRAEAGEGDWAVERLRRAAAGAIRRGAPQGAVAYMRRALAEPVPARRIELLAELAEASWHAYDITAFEGISDDPVAELAQDPQVLREAQFHLGAWLWMSGRIEESRALADHGIQAEREAGNVERALEFEIGLLAVFNVHPGEALARLDGYLGEVEPGSPAERLWIAMHVWWRHFEGGPARDAADLAERALAGGALITEQPDLPASGQAILVLLRADALERAEEFIEAMDEDARRRGSLGAHAMASGLRSQLALRRGQVASAVEEGRPAVAINREQGVGTVVLPFLTGWLVEALTEAGELAEAEAELEASGIAGELPEHFWLVPPRFARARLRAAQGRRAEAIADLRYLAREPLPAEYDVDSTLAILLAAEGEVEEAKRLAEAGISRARDWGTPKAVGVALRAQALVTDGDDGIALMREAVEALEASPNRLEHARALTDLGAALRRANRRREAREALAPGVEMAHRAAAGAIEERAREELAATGAKPRRVMLSGVESLTASELRVARMAAEGMENREIAQALFVTLKTVETHLTHTYRKLDVSSRRELPEALRG